MIGIESSHGFGDICFNLPLIKAIHDKYQDSITVATCSRCKDALYNIPWVSNIIEIPDMYHGAAELKRLGCDPIFQITQNIRFFEFRESDPNHSLVDTPRLTGRLIGLQDFDQTPIFIPTNHELQRAGNYISDRRLIALESIYTSGQSWADKHAFDMIFEKYRDTHRILWLSNNGAPDLPFVDKMHNYTRRELITMLPRCDKFYSVGSGFFCASLGLQQRPSTVCLWRDEFYKYESGLSRLNISHITWVHNHTELSDCL